MRVFERLLALGVVFPLLGGCLPASGPATRSIVNSHARLVPTDYSVVRLDAAIADYVSARPAAGLLATFGTGGAAPGLTIGVGDVVVVTIYEAASGGLFSGEAGTLSGDKSVSLPAQPVAQNGTISVPYVGQVRAAGLTPAGVAAAIEEALRTKAIEPQVMVTVTEPVSTRVTVTGEVNAPGPVPLSLGGDRILDAIAAARGARAPDYDSFVRLTRGGRSASVSLARIVRDPSQNLYLRPGDILYVSVDPQTFTAFGATQQNVSVPFETDRLTLAEAVGRAGGLVDNRADARGLFVFRYEDPLIAANLTGGQAVPAATAAGAAGVPVVYRLDLRDGSGYFAAQRFLMRDGDLLYVSNAPAVELDKVLATLMGGLSAANAAGNILD